MTVLGFFSVSSINAALSVATDHANIEICPGETSNMYHQSSQSAMGSGSSSAEPNSACKRKELKDAIINELGRRKNAKGKRHQAFAKELRKLVILLHAEGDRDAATLPFEEPGSIPEEMYGYYRSRLDTILPNFWEAVVIAEFGDEKVMALLFSVLFWC